MSTSPDPVQVAAGRMAYLSRRDQNNPEALVAARRDFIAAKLEKHVRDALDAAPPLTDKQMEYLAALLTPAAKHASDE